MPYLLQQQATQTAEPSATDLAAQIRAQVNQQLKAAGVSDQAAKSAADRAAQAARQAPQVLSVTKDGKVIVSTSGAPAAPQTPDAPVTMTTVPGIPEDTPFDIPRRVEDLGYGLFLMIAVIAVGKPLARALGSVIERRALRPAMPADFGARLERIEQGIESVSIEVERISESQRYLLKVQAPSAERVELPRSAG